MSSSNIENDCMAIVMYWYRHRGEYISLREASEAIGVDRTTIKRYIDGFVNYDDWWLDLYAQRIGFIVYYTGRPGEWIWVERTY